MTEPWRLHTVVFDLDDTLYPERDYVLSGFKAVAVWLERERGIRGFAAAAAEIFERGSRGKIFDEALGRLGVQDVTGLVPRLVEIYRSHAPAISLPPESAAMLDWAKAKFRLALVSDGYLEVQERKVAALGIARWIDCRVLSDRWGREAWKPSERPFREVMTALSGVPSGYVYVADNPRKDFITARRLGWRTVRLRRAGGEHAAYQPTNEEAAEMEIDSLKTLTNMLSS